MVEAILRNNKKEDCESPYSTKAIIDELMTFMLAGSDTTSNLTVFIVLELAKNPNILKKMKAEIDQQNIKGDEDITALSMKSLTYMEWVVKEGMRLGSPSWSSTERRTLRNTNIVDIPVSKGTILAYFNFPLFYNNDFFENAREFRPERWQNPTPEQELIVSFVFSSGARNCIGKYLAFVETKVLLTKFLLQYGGVEEMNERVLGATLVYGV